MKTEDFKLKLSEIEKKITELKQARYDLEDQYIQANKAINVGDILEISDRKGKRKAVVVGFFIDYNYKVMPKLKKLKKDGSTSRLDDHLWQSENYSVVPK